ncbi:MAG TPA: hypothetical protein VMU87_00650 [Stellaceae bacterium]|nr:hypothetical protein [Stellaceae bacterium]
MAIANVVYGDFNSIGDDLTPYVDSFYPGDHVPFDRVEMAGREIVPPLLRYLDDLGIEAFVGRDLNTVAKLHRASGGRMRRLIQTNDPRYHPNATPADTMVLALMRDGVPQGCVASRLIWCERSLLDEMQSGRFWVMHPVSMWTESDKCIVTAPTAARIRACQVVFTGSIYLAQGVTGGNTLAAMLRLHHLWVLSHWRWSWLVGIIEGALARRHAFDVYGAMGLEIGIWRTRPGEGQELHKYEMTICEREACMDLWLRPEMGLLSRSMGRPPISLLPVDGKRVECEA